MPNRLLHEDSPYLQQHKNDPIDWYPWCDEAFNKAKDNQKAIFISIGYSSCHWCHVMKDEVFTNQKMADEVNKNFICIKVDREERPDIDKHYQEVYQLLNRKSGGWPTSIFCTPENKPIFAGTYIPLHDKSGMTGFSTLTSIIAQKIKEKDVEVYKSADEIINFLKQVQHPNEATILIEDIYKNFLLQAKKNFESSYGGFSQAPKFPYTATLKTLLNIFNLYDDKNAKKMITFTLDNMTLGGMYDIVDGGFCRYSTDIKWLVPHFEKMTYDNALLCELYIKAYLTCKESKYLDTAKEIVAFMDKFMQEDNLFYSASDADSDGGEGIYFTYTKDEIALALQANNYDNDEIKEILYTLHVSKGGNFEGRNIVRYEQSEKLPWYENVIKILQALRKKRKYPFIDKKIQSSWNAMMINSLFLLSDIDTSYLQIAVKHLDKLLRTMFIKDELFHSTLIHKKPKINAFLEDYAYLGVALISAYEATSDEVYLILAQKFANTALAKFYDKGRWFFSKDEFDVQAEASDNTYPSSVGVMIDLLLSLSALLQDDKYREFAFKTLEYNSYELGRKPIYFPNMLSQMLRYLKNDLIIKANQKNLKENSFKIASIKYPYILKKYTDDKDFLLCKKDSCFAHTKDVNDLQKIVQIR